MPKVKVLSAPLIAPTITPTTRMTRNVIQNPLLATIARLSFSASITASRRSTMRIVQ